RLEEDLFVDPLLPADLLDHRDQFSIHLPSHASPRPGHLNIQARLRDLRARIPSPPAALFERQALPPDVRQPSSSPRAPREPAPHGLADRPPVLAIAPELPVEPRGGHLEVIRVADQPRDVEHVTDLPAHALTVANPHAGGLVDEDAEHAARAVRAPLQVDQQEPVIAEHRLDDLFDPVVPLIVAHRHTTKGKKWATPTFSGL